MAQKKKTRRRVRVLTGAMLLALFVTGGILAWRWQAGLRCERIEVVGARRAEVEALVELAGVDTSMALFSIDPLLVEDRLRRHPWVRDVDVTRLPTAALRIRVDERIPAALAMDRKGRPAYYLDRYGFPMPLEQGVAYDVPLLAGLNKPYHPMQPVESEAVRDLLGALADADPNLDALLSELEVLPSGEALLHSAPLAGQGSIPVRLGRSRYTAKLAVLDAFWHKAVLAQPHKKFAWIDLRFEGQVVTQEDTTATAPKRAGDRI